MSNPIWNADWFPVPGQVMFDHDKKQVSTVSRSPANLDLSVIGLDNRV